MSCNTCECPKLKAEGRALRVADREAGVGDRPRLQPHAPRFTVPSNGFTFLEVMVVVVIIGILAGVVAIKVGDYVDKAKVNRARSDISTIVNAVETFYADKGRYPSNEEGLTALPLKNLLDPWNRPYNYNQPGRRGPFEVVSYGADGQEGGQGAAADIHSDELQKETLAPTP